MGYTGTIDAVRVRGIATQIESDNKKLDELLKESKTTIDGLSSFWSDEAAKATKANYDSFANKFFKTYYDLMDQYVKFLRSNVADQFGDVKRTNTKLADAFK